VGGGGWGFCVKEKEVLRLIPVTDRPPPYFLFDVGGLGLSTRGLGEGMNKRILGTNGGASPACYFQRDMNVP